MCSLQLVLNNGIYSSMKNELYQQYDSSAYESCSDWSEDEDEDEDYYSPQSKSSYPELKSEFSLSPDDHMKSLLISQGIVTKASPSLEFKDFFLEIADKNILAYEKDVVDAFRSENFEKIKTFHKEGKLLQCCNKFGESVVHLACRMGCYDILSFLVSEANVSIRVRDDWGRTALHDACWSKNPNFDLIKLLLNECPDLLLMKDGRGFTPLDYIPQILWGEWCKFLEENEDMLKPKFIAFGTVLSESKHKLNKKRKRECSVNLR